MEKLLQSTFAYSLLEREKKHGRLANAYLLLFADEKNLRGALRIFAPLFFSRPDSRIPREIHPDCIFLPQEGKTLTVDDAERIVEECTLSPVEGGEKLFVLDAFHKASPVVQNKLLKVLEEPPENVFFLLGATNGFSVLPTVLSRTERLEIPPFPARKIEECLLRLYPDKSDLSLFAEAAEGSLSRAQDLLLGGRYAELEEKAFACAAASADTIPAVTRELSFVKEKGEFVSILRRIYRDMLFYKEGLPITQSKKTERLKVLSRRFSRRALVFALDTFAESEKELNFNANLSQCVETALFKIEKETRK